MIVEQRSEDKYLEVKTASLISKRLRETVIKQINDNPEFQINGLSVGSGNAGDSQTIVWLKEWWKKKKFWPWFVKSSFKTVREIEGKKGKVKKSSLVIDERLLSKEFIDEFNKGKFSIETLSIICPYCRSILKSVEFVIFEKNGKEINGVKCTNKECGRIIENVGITLRYYCGSVLPDSSALQRNIISQDLNTSKFFENFSIILSPIVRKECKDKPQGKREFEELSKLASIERIRLENIGKIEEIPDSLSKEERYERIIKDCITYNAIY